MNLILCSENGSFCLTLVDSVVEKITRLAIKSGSFETGGILLGHIDDSLRHVTAVEASNPPEDSKYGRLFFFRGTEGIDKLLAWGTEQDPPLFYIGEWHSHPNGSAQPSSVDINQMKDFSIKNAFGATTPTIVIIGGKMSSKPSWKAALIGKGKEVIYLSVL